MVGGPWQPIMVLPTLFLLFIQAARHTQARCFSTADCIVGKYCTDKKECVDCSAISPGRCDAIATGTMQEGLFHPCCTADILGNCPSNPNHCRGPGVVEGCTDSSASNYNPSASVEDGSCEYDCATLKTREAWGSGFVACYIFDNSLRKWPEGWADKPANSPTGCTRLSGPKADPSTCGSVGCCGRRYTPDHSTNGIGGSTTLSVPGRHVSGEVRATAGDGWIIQGRLLLQNGGFTYAELDSRIEVFGAKLTLRFVRISKQYVEVCTRAAQDCDGPATLRAEDPRGGGAIWASNAIVSTTHVIFDGNSAVGERWVDPTGDVSGSLPGFVYGGAIAAKYCMITIHSTLFINNTVRGGSNTGGGAISSQGANGMLNISVAHFAANTAPNPDPRQASKKYVYGDAIVYRAAKPTAAANEAFANRMQLLATNFEPFDNWDTVSIGGSWLAGVGGCNEHPCKPGESCKYSNYSKWCTKCPPITVGNDGIDCVPCPSGQGPVEDGGVTTCVNCTDNEYSTQGVCVKCRQGQIVNSDRSGCTSPLCTRGRIPSSTGKCVCPRGFYDAEDLVLVCFYHDFHQSDVDKALARVAESPCQPCPPCAISCSDGSADVTIASGFTVPSNYSSHPQWPASYRAAFRCDNTHQNEAEHSSCKMTQLLSVQQMDAQRCIDNATGLLCQSCDRGFQRNVGVCTSCDAHGSNWLPPVIVASVIVALLLCTRVRLCAQKRQILSSLSVHSRHSEAQEPLQPAEQGQHGVLSLFVRAAVQPTRIIITYFQVATQLGQSLHTMLPPIFISWVEPARKVLNVFNMFALDCANLGSFLSRWLLNVVALPLSLLAIVLLVYCYLWRIETLRARAKRQRGSGGGSAEHGSVARRQAKELLYFVVFLVYPTVCNVAFSSLNCRQLSSAASVLVDDDRVLCEDASHWYLQLASVAVILVVGFGTPAYFGTKMILASRRQQQNQDEDKLFLVLKDEEHFATESKEEERAVEYVVRDVWSSFREFSFLLNAFVPRHYYWETLDMVRKLVLVGGVLVVGRGTTAQITVALAFSLFFIALHTRTWPYKLPADNILRLLTELHVFLMIVIALALKGDLADELLGSDDYDWIALSSFLLCVPLAFGGAVLSHSLEMMNMKGMDMKATFKRAQCGLASEKDTKVLHDCIARVRQELGLDLSADDHRVLEWLREELEMTPDTADVATVQRAYQVCSLPFDETASLKTLVKDAAEDIAARAQQNQQQGVFLSHFQANAGPDLMELKGQLQDRHPSLDKVIWFDKDNDPSIEGMRKGVRDNKYFIAYLTTGYLKRPFCRKEIRWALMYKKEIILLWKREGKGSVGRFNDFFDDCKESAWVAGGAREDGGGEDLQAIFDKPAISYYCDGHFHESSMTELASRLGLVPGSANTACQGSIRQVLLAFSQDAQAQVQTIVRELHRQAPALDKRLDVEHYVVTNKLQHDSGGVDPSSHCVLLYLTESVWSLQDTSVLESVVSAKKAGANIVTVVETDMEHGWTVYKEAQGPEANVGWKDAIDHLKNQQTPAEYSVAIQELFSHAIPFLKDQAFRNAGIQKMLEKMGAEHVQVSHTLDLEQGDSEPQPEFASDDTEAMQIGGSE